jgi:hypothetical protein
MVSLSHPQKLSKLFTTYCRLAQKNLLLTRVNSLNKWGYGDVWGTNLKNRTMLQDSIITKQRYERFIKKVCETEMVWGLENAEGVATTSSNDFEDENEEPLELICFWSEKALAKGCAKEEWKGYKTVEIKLSDFIENWCIGMANDNLMAGSDFDQNLFGFEIDPLELIVDLDNELKLLGKAIRLQNYQRMDDLVNEVKKILSE